MTKESKPECKFLPVYEKKIAVSASCACGSSFTPPADVDEGSYKYFHDQFKKHYAEQYGSEEV